MAFKKILILHNELSGESRYFVSGNYDPETMDVIDWYQDVDGRIEYEAAGLPSPSAFPTIVNTETGAFVRLPNNLEDALAKLNGEKTTAEKLAELQELVANLQSEIENLKAQSEAAA